MTSRTEQLEAINNQIEFERKYLEEYKKELKKNYAIAKTATYFLHGLNDKECKKLRNLIHNLTSSKINIKFIIEKQIEELLEKHEGFGNSDSYINIENKLINELKAQNINTNEVDTPSVSGAIAITPDKEIKNAIKRYLMYVKTIKRIKQKIEELEDKKRNLPILDTTKEDLENKQNKFKKTTQKDKTTVQKKKNIEAVQKLPSTMTYYEIITYIINKNANKTIYNSNKFKYLEEEDKKLLAEYIGDEAYNQESLFIEISTKLLRKNTVNNTIKKFNDYNKKLIKSKKLKKPTIEELLDIAVIAFNSIPNYLMTEEINSNKKNIQIRNDIRNRCNPLYYLESYESAYNIYKEYYESLSTEEQKVAREEFGDGNYNYLDLGITSFQILSPESLKNKINESIKKEILNNYIVYGKNQSYSEIKQINNTTTLMEITEIVNIYKEIKKLKIESIKYHEKIGKPLPNQAQWFQNLQYNFCKAIFYRQTQNLSESELKQINEDKEMYIICTQVLGEDPLFITEKYDIEPKKPKSVMEEAALANERFFNMSKIEQTFNRINGNWKKFEEKLEEMVNTESIFEEQEIREEFKGMFR